jgi:hypothetical protein
MPRTPLRLFVAAGTLCALLVTGVSPAVARVVAGASADSHACCPETIRETAAEGHQAGAPMPCCAIGNTRQPAPVRGTTPVRGAASMTPAGPDHFYTPPVCPAAPLVAPSTIPLGQIPPLLRTSVLLI